MTKQSYDVDVICGGHAGCEAATASARMGVNAALLLIKSRLLVKCLAIPYRRAWKRASWREIDALDGVMGVVADKSGIQFRLLNKVVDQQCKDQGLNQTELFIKSICKRFY